MANDPRCRQGFSPPFVCCPPGDCIGKYTGYGVGLVQALGPKSSLTLTRVRESISAMKAILDPINPEAPGYNWPTNPGYTIFGYVQANGTFNGFPTSDPEECWFIPTGIGGYSELNYWLGWAGIRILLLNNYICLAVAKLRAVTIQPGAAWCISTSFWQGPSKINESCEEKLSEPVIDLEVPDWLPTTLPSISTGYYACTYGHFGFSVAQDHQYYEVMPWPRDGCPLSRRASCCPGLAP